MIAVPNRLADVERDLMHARIGPGRRRRAGTWADRRGSRRGSKPRRTDGATLQELADSHDVVRETISGLP